MLNNELLLMHSISKLLKLFVADNFSMKSNSTNVNNKQKVLIEYGVFQGYVFEPVYFLCYSTFLSFLNVLVLILMSLTF